MNEIAKRENARKKERDRGSAVLVKKRKLRNASYNAWTRVVFRYGRESKKEKKKKIK